MDTYIATNTVDGRFYIGSSTNFRRRKQQHLECQESYPFQNALRQNPDAFEWEVWSDDSDERILEQALLDMWFGCEQCYNLTSKATGFGPETAAKGGKRTHELHPELMSENGRKVGAKNLLKWQKECPEEMAAAVKKASDIGHERNKGRHSEWGKMGAKQGGEATAKLKSKPVICIETGVCYLSINDASRQCGINKNCIMRCCHGMQKTAGKLHWQFYKPEENV
jgi:group I intron endonuclease